MRIIIDDEVYEVYEQMPKDVGMYKYGKQKFIVNGGRLYIVDDTQLDARIVYGVEIKVTEGFGGTQAKFIGVSTDQYGRLIFTFDNGVYYVCRNVDDWRYLIGEYMKSKVDGLLIPCYGITEIMYKDYVLLADEKYRRVSFLVKGNDVIRLGLEVGINRVYEAIDEGLVDFLVQLSNMKVPYVGGVYIPHFLKYKHMSIRKLYERMKEPWVVEELLLGEGLPARQLKLAKELIDKVEMCKDFADLSIVIRANYDVYIYNHDMQALVFYADFKKEIKYSVATDPFFVELYKKYPLSRKLSEKGLKVWASVIKRYGVRHDS